MHQFQNMALDINVIAEVISLVIIAVLGKWIHSTSKVAKSGSGAHSETAKALEVVGRVCQNMDSKLDMLMKQQSNVEANAMISEIKTEVLLMHEATKDIKRKVIT